MSDQLEPETPHRNNPAISLLRIFLWLLPSVLVATLIGSIRHTTIHGVYLVSMCIAVLSVIGCLDQMLKLLQLPAEERAEKEAVAFGVVMFVILQFAITPFISAALFFGMCLTKAFSL